ncbi:cytochrome P450 [Phenylobacterium aquaticum]|uniref:cytochrome P450 n=1 Tax=Phenylobacterium aquaticum TaxID=1763816 RepID=UPI001F5DFBE1|nr:cytochrome P450 [Phenylobacterium aquaticum]MCI3133527.1 cytochrome P450 [Phenylobacterium aquaticum]
MSDGAVDIRDEARARAYAVPLDQVNPAQPELFADNQIWPTFERLRREDPVHFTAESDYGPYWSITRYNDIMAVDTNHEVFSSADGIVLASLESKAQAAGRAPRPSFISMDPPKHDVQRKTVSPAVAPANLHRMAPVIRERAGLILDGLPIGEEFDWVDLVSKELTAMTLATLFDFPFEDRRKLTHWSDVMTNAPGFGPVTSWDQKRQEIGECFAAFTDLWNERLNAPPGGDLISMLAHGEATRDMDIHEYHGNVTLLIIGGNDTTRNTISGSVYALNQNPAQYAKLKADPSLITSMVSETIRWQTPLAHMARTATRDFELHGKTIKAGDRVAMWYVSGNRDDEVIANPDSYIIDRERPRQHLSFGFGVHRCVGNRLAELQLTIIWEEMLKRFPDIQVVAEPTRTHSVFVKGYETLPVIIPTRN